MPASLRPDISSPTRPFDSGQTLGSQTPSPPTIRHLSATPGSAIHWRARILGMGLRGRRGRGGVNRVTRARRALGNTKTSRPPIFVRLRLPSLWSSMIAFLSRHWAVAGKQAAPHIRDQRLFMHPWSESGIVWPSSSHNHTRTRISTHTQSSTSRQRDKNGRASLLPSSMWTHETSPRRAQFDLLEGLMLCDTDTTGRGKDRLRNSTSF